MRNLTAIFWKGLATLLPLIVTLYVLYWAVSRLEQLLRQLVPPEAYFPGSGLLLAVIIIAAFGALMHFFLFERLIRLGAGVLNRIPLVKSVYSALEDFFAYLGHRSTDDLSRVVLVTLAGGEQLIGFVTNPRFRLPGREDHDTADPAPAARQAAADRLSASRVPADRVSVYIPMSYQLGGFMVLLPAERLTPLDISVEDAMRLVLTAGVRKHS